MKQAKQMELDKIRDKRHLVKKSYEEQIKNREYDLREAAQKLEKQDRDKKAKMEAEQIKKEKDRFIADLENLEKQASKQGE